MANDASHLKESQYYVYAGHMCHFLGQTQKWKFSTKSMTGDLTTLADFLTFLDWR